MTEYNVYEIRERGDSFIGSITADSQKEAAKIARDVYGAPIKVTD